MFGELFKWFFEPLGWLVTVLGSAGVYFGWVNFFKEPIARGLRKTDNPDGWQRRREEASSRIRADQAGAHERYRRVIDNLLARAEAFYGPNTLNFRAQWQAFDRCLLIAFIYPLALFVVGWLLGGSGTFGVAGEGLEVLPTLPFWQRPILALILLGVGVGIGLFIFREAPKKFGLWAAGRLPASISRRSSQIIATFAEYALFFAVVGGAFGVGAVVGTVVSVGVYGIVVGVVIGGVGGGLSSLVGGGRGRAIFVVGGLGSVGNVFVIVVGTIGIFGVSGFNKFSVIILILWVFLPIVNAVFDYLSLQATRFLLGRVRRVGHNWVGLTLDLALDAVLALGCLAGLAFGTGALLELASQLSQGTRQGEILWVANLAAATHSTFGDGFLFIGMLMTTLVPTMIHLVLGLLAIATHFTARAAELASRFRDDMDEVDINAVAHYLALREARRLFGIGLAVLLSILIVSGIFRIGVFDTNTDGMPTAHPATNLLVRTTLCGASLVNGRECPLLQRPKPTDQMPGQRAVPATRT